MQKGTTANKNGGPPVLFSSTSGTDRYPTTAAYDETTKKWVCGFAAETLIQQAQSEGKEVVYVRHLRDLLFATFADYQDSSNGLNGPHGTPFGVRSTSRASSLGIAVQIPSSGRVFEMVEIVAAFLRALVFDELMSFLGIPTREVCAVIAVPVTATDKQRQLIKDAATIAGMDCLRIINEASAALIAVDAVKDGDKQEVHDLVVDWGAQGLRLSLVGLEDGIIEQLMNEFCPFNSDVFDEAIFKCVTDRADISRLSEKQRARLRRQCYGVRTRLCTQASTKVEIDDLDQEVTVSRVAFEKASQDAANFLQESLIGFVEKAKQQADFRLFFPLSRVVLTGELCEMDLVLRHTKMLEAEFPAAHTTITRAGRCGLDISKGCALQCDKIEHSKSQPADFMCSLCFVPLNLYVEVGNEGYCIPVIPRNTTIPCRKTTTLVTGEDNQECATIRVIEGARPLASEGRQLGAMTITGLPKAPAGDVSVTVTYDIDPNEILAITANVVCANNPTFSPKSVVMTPPQILITNDNPDLRFRAGDIDALVNAARAVEKSDNAEAERQQLRSKLLLTLRRLSRAHDDTVLQNALKRVESSEEDGLVIEDFQDILEEVRRACPGFTDEFSSLQYFFTLPK